MLITLQRAFQNFVSQHYNIFCMQQYMWHKMHYLNIIRHIKTFCGMNNVFPRRDTQLQTETIHAYYIIPVRLYQAKMYVQVSLFFLYTVTWLRFGMTILNTGQLYPGKIHEKKKRVDRTPGQKQQVYYILFCGHDHFSLS